jgi:glucose dehydrogenase
MNLQRPEKMMLAETLKAIFQPARPGPEVLARMLPDKPNFCGAGISKVAGQGWPQYGGSGGGQRYSAAQQINQHGDTRVAFALK